MSDQTQWDTAQELVEYGWSIIPINSGQDGKEKKPLIKWMHYQNERPSYEQVEFWRDEYPRAAVGVVTGAISGFVIVDCDTDDALAYAKECKVWSPVRVKTPRGVHLVFRHPMDGRRFGPRVGSNSTGIDWPEFKGLDFRGDGSYAITYTAAGYRIDCDEGYSIFDLDDVPVWDGWPMGDAGSADITEIDLSSNRLVADGGEWERTAQFVGENYPGARIPTGASNGRNDRVAKFAGECVAKGLYGHELEERVCAFMDAFYMDRLDEKEWKATCASVEAAERRNHPERVAENEAKKEKVKDDVAAMVAPPKVMLLADAPALAASAAAQSYLIEPWLPPASYAHVSGYTGHGKSVVVSNIMAAASAGLPSLGPFEFPRPIRVLYLDYENGKITLSRRFEQMLKSYGDPKDRMQVWTPWLARQDMSLLDNESLKVLSALIKEAKPDVVVIDTIRSAFPALEENSAEAWARVNNLVKRLQNYGIAVVALHHKNKPQHGGGFSREAGSSAQLNLVENQLYVTQVYRDKSRALATAGIHDESYEEPIWPRMEGKAHSELGIDWLPQAVFEVQFGKVRDWTDMHTPRQWMAICANISSGQEKMIGSTSIRQRALKMYAGGQLDIDIARSLGLSIFTVRSWLGI